MGWLFTDGQTRKELIEKCLRPWKSPHSSDWALAHCTRGNVLWVVWEYYTQATGHFERVILCILLQRSSDGWGYKDLDEGCGPCYYSCPEKYLTMGTRVLNRKWREGVRKYHVMRRARAAVRATRKRARFQLTNA
jgi:hypothetical protein